MIKFITLLLLVFSINAYAFQQVGDSCDKHPGLSDSYVLALSSQPGFCQTYGYEAGKPECKHLSKNSYQAKHLTLHGLWPNQKACGLNYGYCGVEQKMSHCAYPPVDLSPQVSNSLKKLMPSYYYGSCLERHEWNRHGSCQILSADQYFALAIRFTEAADNSLFGQFLTQHQGQKVQLTQLREMIATSFGPTNASKIYLGCKKGILVDIYIQLPALIPYDDSLESLVSDAPESQTHDTCPTNVILSNFNTESLDSIN